MEPKISYITLGVDDLHASLAFYRDVLGLPTKGIIGEDDEHGGVVFFKMAGGLTFGLWSRKDIAADSGVEVGGPDPSAVMLAHNVKNKRDVETIMAQIPSKYVKKRPRDLFWGGYGGVFADPDGHLWEVVYNPF